ncbi:MAG TPA: acyltransferase, partial [Solirubrobacteraceae bacterium]|nr:acyltransferase [Solirubrobacteraceae bacterium]
MPNLPRAGVAPPRRLGRRPVLDGLRGVAVLLVIAEHTGLLHNGFLGVDVFFVLSGFLITTLLLEEFQRAGRISLRGFYARRARRLVPALLVAVAAFLVISAAADQSGFGDDVLAAAAGVTYITNILMALTPTWLPAVGHLWSLGAEEQFYLLWPVVLIAAIRRSVSRRAL